MKRWRVTGVTQSFLYSHLSKLYLKDKGRRKLTIALKEIDAKILRALLIDGRSDLVFIAKKLKITEKTVWNRYTSLKKSGVIIGATTHVDYRRIGYGTYSHFTIKMNPNKVNEAIKKIEKLPGVYMVAKGIQNYSLMVGLSIKNQNEIDFVKKNYILSL